MTAPDPYSPEFEEIVYRVRYDVYLSLLTGNAHVQDAPDPLYEKPPRTGWRDTLRWMRRVILHPYRPERITVVHVMPNPRMHTRLTGITS